MWQDKLGTHIRTLLKTENEKKRSCFVSLTVLLLAQLLNLQRHRLALR
jgi:hypothetical protein